jgi:hypothetical protein
MEDADFGYGDWECTVAVDLVHDYELQSYTIWPKSASNIIINSQLRHLAAAFLRTEHTVSHSALSPSYLARRD